VTRSFDRQLKQAGLIIGLVLALATALVALVVQPASRPPLEVARGGARLIVLLGAIGALIYLLHAKLPRRIAGIRTPKLHLLVFLYSTTGGGSLLLLAGGAALLLMSGDPGRSRLHTVVLVGVLQAVATLGFALGLSLVAFLSTSRRDQVLGLALILLPALASATIAFYFSIAAWRAASP
jgi:hypothetical protein